MYWIEFGKSKNNSRFLNVGPRSKVPASARWMARLCPGFMLISLFRRHFCVIFPYEKNPPLGFPGGLFL